nr:hypothetical protein [Tanacetum cinerariifolium]
AHRIGQRGAGGGPGRGGGLPARHPGGAARPAHRLAALHRLRGRRQRGSGPHGRPLRRPPAARARQRAGGAAAAGPRAAGARGGRRCPQAGARAAGRAHGEHPLRHGRRGCHSHRPAHSAPPAFSARNHFG